MKSIGIITDSIDVTVMGVCHTLVNIYEEKLQTWEVGGTFLLTFTHVQGSFIHSFTHSFIHWFIFAINQEYSNSIQKYIKDNIQYSN